MEHDRYLPITRQCDSKEAVPRQLLRLQQCKNLWKDFGQRPLLHGIALYFTCLHRVVSSWM